MHTYRKRQNLYRSNSAENRVGILKDLMINIALLRWRASVHTHLTHDSVPVNIFLRLEIFSHAQLRFSHGLLGGYMSKYSTTTLALGGARPPHTCQHVSKEILEIADISHGQLSFSHSQLIYFPHSHGLFG